MAFVRMTSDHGPRAPLQLVELIADGTEMFLYCDLQRFPVDANPVGKPVCLRAPMRTPYRNLIELISTEAHNRDALVDLRANAFAIGIPLPGFIGDQSYVSAVQYYIIDADQYERAHSLPVIEWEIAGFC